MAGRLYVCPVVGTGTDEDPQRPLIADKTSALPGGGVTAWSASIGTNPDGKKTFTWAICWADTLYVENGVTKQGSWALVDADNQCFQLTADALSAAPTNRVRNYLVNNGVMTRAEANGYATLRDIADALIRRHYGHSSLAEAFPQIGA